MDAGTLPLRRMAVKAGVNSRWLKAQAEAKRIPALNTGKRWIFNPDVVLPIIAKMAGEFQDEKPQCL